MTEGTSSAFRSEYCLFTSKYNDSYDNKIATTDKKTIAISENTVQNTGPVKKIQNSPESSIKYQYWRNNYKKFLQQPTGACLELGTWTRIFGRGSNSSSSSSSVFTLEYELLFDRCDDILAQLFCFNVLKCYFFCAFSWSQRLPNKLTNKKCSKWFNHQTKLLNQRK